MKYSFKEYLPSEMMEGHIKAGGNDNKGGSISVNSRYISKDNSPWIGVMGEYHFQRDNRENWKKELLKMKAGGITIVATYLFWIYLEEEEGKWNFEGDNDLRAFLTTVKECGLNAVLRVGPWAHGECRNGGFPDWILKKPFEIRTDNDGYLSYVRMFFEKIYENSHEFLYKDGGPVIAVQVENELVDNAEHILTLKNMCLDIGFDVPLYTATGWNARFGAKLPLDEVLPVFGAYADAPWSEVVAELPLSAHYAFHTERNDAGIGVDLIKEKNVDGYHLPYERYPYATCEIGPGMQSTHHRRVVMAGIDAYAMSLVKLGVGNNLIGYYMYHGGTNKLGKLSTFNEDKATGYPNEYAHIHYDFGTCISQYGEIREQYRLLNLLHLFVNDFGALLAPMESVAAKDFADENNETDLRYCMRTDGKSAFIFVNNYQRHGKTKEQKNVSFEALDVLLPEITVKENVAFILPVNVKLENENLKCATAMLLAREGNVFYFAGLPGNEAKYVFEDGSEYTGSFTKGDIEVKTIPFEEARYLRKLSGHVHITPGKDIYEMDGEIKEVTVSVADSKLSDAKEQKVDFYPYEMEINGKRALTWKKLDVLSNEGYVVIDIPDYDVAQIYADGKLVADNFNEFIEWHVPASLLYGKECYLVMSELKDDFYVNREDVKRVRAERSLL